MHNWGTVSLDIRSPTVYGGACCQSTFKIPKLRNHILGTSLYHVYVLKNHEIEKNILYALN